MKVNDVKSCSFPSWYKTFEDVTIKSIILTISSEALSYLQDKGTVVIPEEADPKDLSEHDPVEYWESASPVASAPDLKEFSQKIRKSIRKLGGSAFPKLNWSSPKDAVWISYNKSLQCSNHSDVYLLLKSSDFVAHDLTCPYKDCLDIEEEDVETSYCLILRKWVEINPSDEFRCFVKNREIIGISQRDISQEYKSIYMEKHLIVKDIVSFFEKHIRNHFHLFSYVFDVHRPRKGSVTLIDFGPFGNTTDSLMFTWGELNNMGRCNVPNTADLNLIEDCCWEFATKPYFRYITNGVGIQPSPYAHCGLPVDFIDLSTGQDPAKFVDFLQMKIQKPDEDYSDSEDDEKIVQKESIFIEI